MHKPGSSAAELLRHSIECHRDGRLDEARKGYERLLRKDPKDGNALNLLGVLLASQNQLTRGIQLMRRAVVAYPDFPDALSNLGKALLDSGDPAAALGMCNRALALAPTDPETLNNRGNALLALGRTEDALASYRHALAHRPDFAEALTNEGLSLLSLGELTLGLQRYEHRWQLPRLAPTQLGFAAPRWTGAEPVAGKRLLLHAEQGLGDTLQFCRYASLLADRGAKVVLEVQAPLLRLIATLRGVDQMIAEGGVRPPVDYQCPLLSLPLAFGTGLDTIPAEIPYLHPAPSAVDAWRARLDAFPTPHIGLVWAGNPRRNDPEANSVDQRRSMKLAAFAGLPDATFVSLQKGEPAHQARTPPSGLRLVDWTDELADFADTAALVAALDLVIGVDTSVVHVAGAIGAKVWVLNRYDRCWRWFKDRDDSPWYSTMRLFTQSRPGDWAGVVQAVGQAMKDWV